mmetsp:Transcript_12923/g.17847  ORF Transcript_12923/g.17847 Transcript_12923/m.17847 type:complete len:425 (-) Transcript_12923:89-1363(-)
MAATPGRMLDFAKEGLLSLSNVYLLVLDEADRLFQKSLTSQLEELREILMERRDARYPQIAMVTATISEELHQAFDIWSGDRSNRKRTIIDLNTHAKEGEQGPEQDKSNRKRAKEDVSCAKASSNQIIEDVVAVSSETERTEPAPSFDVEKFSIPNTVEQIVHVCAPHKKLKKLIKLMQKIDSEDKAQSRRQPTQTLIFCNKIKTVEDVWRFMVKNHRRAQRIHGKVDQKKRERTLLEFRAGKIRELIATNVAARGLHVKNLTSVINYDFPGNVEEYVHRVGRTGRSGNAGRAWSFFTRNLAKLAPSIVKLLRKTNQKLDPNLVTLAEETSKHRKNSRSGNVAKCEVLTKLDERVAEAPSSEGNRDVQQPQGIHATTHHQKKRRRKKKRKKSKVLKALDSFGIPEENEDEEANQAEIGAKRCRS